MTFQIEKQSFFTKELTNNCPLLAASGGSSGESVIGLRWNERPQAPYFSD